MNKPLRYQISNWNQITKCKSNNSRNLFLSLSEYVGKNTLRGTLLSVRHANYGVLFATLINGEGSLLSTVDEEGNDLPFLTTDEILKQIERFGFYVEYDEKEDLPSDTLAFLATVDNLGYDKITVVYLEGVDLSNRRVWRPTVLVIKSESNTDLLTFGCKLTRKKYEQKLDANTIMNVTHEPNLSWDWVTYIANIEDILTENVYDLDNPHHAPHSLRPPMPIAELTEYEGASDDLQETDGDDRTAEVISVADDPDAYTQEEGTLYVD